MTKEEIESKRKEIDIDNFDPIDFLDRNKLSFIIEKLSEIKNEYGDITLELESSEYSFFAHYRRKETDEEVIKRIEELENYAKHYKNQRRQQYLLLKKEFESENI
jgi:hypothetical protein